MALNGNKRHTAPVFGKYNNNKKTDKNKQKIQIIEIKTLHQISTATANSQRQSGQGYKLINNYSPYQYHHHRRERAWKLELLEPLCIKYFMCIAGKNKGKTTFEIWKGKNCKRKLFLSPSRHLMVGARKITMFTKFISCHSNRHHMILPTRARTNMVMLLLLLIRWERIVRFHYRHTRYWSAIPRFHQWFVRCSPRVDVFPVLSRVALSEEVVGDPIS